MRLAAVVGAGLAVCLVGVVVAKFPSIVTILAQSQVKNLITIVVVHHAHVVAIVHHIEADTRRATVVPLSDEVFVDGVIRDFSFGGLSLKYKRTLIMKNYEQNIKQQHNTNFHAIYFSEIYFKINRFI